jgi:ketosteroid isomerase-like protein
MQKVLLLIVIILIKTSPLFAQEKKAAPTSTELYNEIARMDSILFNAFNTQDINKFKSLFTEDLEWFQDNGGLLPAKSIFESVEINFKKENKLTRQLVEGSLEVHPIKDYGAIEIGAHRFRHRENGKEEIATFKFLMIWKKTDNSWKISRVVSYDH